MTLLLVHGWGFDRSVWAPFRAALGGAVDIAEADLGYFSDPCLPQLAGPVVAVGHSFGAMWLLRHPPPRCLALVAINGFDRFTQGGDAAGAPRRLLDRMLRRLEAEPQAVVEDFRERCGGDRALPGPPRADRLREDLLALRDGDERAAARAFPAPILSLQGAQDPILPQALREAAFSAAADVRVAGSPPGGHLLPVSDAPWCAAQVRGFLEARGVTA